MKCRRNRIVVFLGAGFPLPWGAPSSGMLKDSVIEVLKETSFSFLTERISDSFEDLIAALYSYSVFPFNHFQQSLFQERIPDGTDLNDAASLYLRCINLVMNDIHTYEHNCNSSSNKTRNQSLQLLFKVLGSKYRHISVYTTNYDEVLPRILGWGESTMSLRDDHYIYNPLSEHKLKYSYSNLHGSIHLEMARFGGQQYEISHNSSFFPQTNLHEIYGGNPYEIDLFTPIIVGHNKTQTILSKHFNYVITCFANDLSDCDTLLSIGSSFSDPHLNSLIRQYTLFRGVNYRIVCMENDVPSSYLDNNISSQIIAYEAKYSPDTQDNKLFSRENGRLVYYKHGTDAFLEDRLFWNDYL